MLTDQYDNKERCQSDIKGIDSDLATLFVRPLDCNKRTFAIEGRVGFLAAQRLVGGVGRLLLLGEAA